MTAKNHTDCSGPDLKERGKGGRRSGETEVREAGLQQTSFGFKSCRLCYLLAV